MAKYNYESLLHNPPARVNTDHKAAYLEPYFFRMKSIEQISAETGRSVEQLNGWRRNELSAIDEAVSKQEQAYAECREQLEALREQINGSCLTAEKILEYGFEYQDVFLGYKKPASLAEDLGVDLEVIRRHLNFLYGKLHGVVAEREKTIGLFMQGVSQQGGQNG